MYIMNANRSGPAGPFNEDGIGKICEIAYFYLSCDSKFITFNLELYSLVEN